MAPGSAELRSLYLDDSEIGVPWLLDPGSGAVASALRTAAGLDDWAAAWRGRLTTERPATWGAALGTAFHELRQLVGDRHLSAAGEDGQRLRAVDPRADEPVLADDPGATVSEELVDGVLALRIRNFQAVGAGAGGVALARWRDAHARHFSHDRIVVDLRGNPGGGSIAARDWLREHVPEPFAFVPGQRWLLNGRPLVWNTIVGAELVDGADAVPAPIRETAPVPAPGSVLAVGSEQWRFEAGTQPWRGRMLVLVDRRTGSAGEGVAWLLRLASGRGSRGGRRPVR